MKLFGYRIVAIPDEDWDQSGERLTGLQKALTAAEADRDAARAANARLETALDEIRDATMRALHPALYKSGNVDPTGTASGEIGLRGNAHGVVFSRAGGEVQQALAERIRQTGNANDPS